MNHEWIWGWTVHIGYESNVHIKLLSFVTYSFRISTHLIQTHSFSSLSYQCHYARNVMAPLKPPGQQCSYRQWLHPINLKNVGWLLLPQAIVTNTQFLNIKALLITRESVGSDRNISGGKSQKELLVPGLLCQGLEITHQLSLSHWCVGLPGLGPYLLFSTTLATAVPVPITKWSMTLEKSMFPWTWRK